MLVLACYPCLDTDHDSHEDSQLISIVEIKLSNHSPIEGEGEHQKDHCSPLCMCHCCHTPIDVPVLSELIMLSTELTFQSHYSFRQVDELVESVFRPPIFA